MNSARAILHVDMDAFYASVEVKDNPSLQGKPVLVGGAATQRGVVAACSYPARKYGIHSAMPMSRALRLCPHAIVLPVRLPRYVEVSRQIQTIFQNYTPEVEPLSLDEAFLDVTGSQALFGSAEQIGQTIKFEIKSQTGLTASVGVAPNKFLAKLASDLEKPDGFVIITEQTKQSILDPLPVTRIWGIGKVTAQRLNQIGIITVLQLRTAPRDKLVRILGNQTEEILQLARGIDHRPVVSQTEAKSLSAEETFANDIDDKETLKQILVHQVEEVSQRLRAEKLQCRTITLKFRYDDFRTITRSVTLNQSTHITDLLLQEALKIFNQWRQTSQGPLRLLGFGTSNLSSAGSGQQLLFTDPEEEKQKKLDTAFDQIREKYGNDSIRRGS